MRIPIREQLGALVLLSILVALAVVTIATWITNHTFVLNIRSSRLALTASLKAAQLSSNLALMENSAKALTTRVKLQSALVTYNTGRIPNDNWEAQEADLAAAIDRGSEDTFTLQAIVFPSYGSGPGDVNGLFNVSGSGSNSNIRLPYNAQDGSPIYLGDSNLGYPPNLYPNLTYYPIDGDQNAYFQGQPLSTKSSILLGPWRVNESIILMSITLPVIDNSSPSIILGWMTVLMSTQLISDVVSSPVGLDRTGTTLLLAPATLTSRFSGTFEHETPPFPQSQRSLSDERVRFFMTPPEGHYPVKRHMRYVNESNDIPFNLARYPAALEAFTDNDYRINNAGSVIKTKNEEHFDVSVGYAIPKTRLMQSVLIVEETQEEVWAPISHLRNILLGCAHFSSQPIRRLREATERSIRPRAYSPDSPDERRLYSQTPDDEEPNDTKTVPSSRPVPDRHFSWRVIFGRRKSGDSEQHKPLEKNEDPESTTKMFRIPRKVKDRKHWIQDELTDLTQTFNEMSDELLRHYEILEERVKARTRELEVSKRNAEAANESKTLFIANISHELKTPLNGILGMATVALQEDDHARIKRSLRVIYKSGDLLHNLLTDLLTFSKNQVGRNLSLDEKDFRVRDIGSQLHAIFDTQAEESQVNFFIDYQGTCDAVGSVEEGIIKQYGPLGTGRIKDMHLWGDQHRILQVAINLVSNSLKFTPAGGQVRLTIRCTGEVTEPQLDRRVSQESKMSKKRPTYRLWNLSKSRSDTKSVSSRASKGPKDEDASDGAAATNVSDLQKQTPFVPTSLDQDVGPPHNARTLLFEIEVEDTGPGIPEHLQKQIFEPFVQADLRLTKRYGGTGLGLSICSQLATLMNGRITLESEIGHGSIFTFQVPLKFVTIRSDSTATSSAGVSRVNSISTNDPRAPISAEQTESTDATDAVLEKQPQFDRDKPRLIGLSQPFFSSGKPPMASPGIEGPKRDHKLRVLVAEDNKVNQEVVLRMLRLEEVFDVHIAKDGQEALDKVKASMEAQSPYDLVLMDIQMPYLDGRESTRMIRQIGYSAPIVALTAFSDEINQRECLESGIDYFIEKPLRRPVLKHVLRTYCPPIQEDEEAEGRTLGGDATNQYAPTDLLRMTSNEISPGTTPDAQA